MEMILLFLFIGWTFATTVVNGSIFDRIRNWLLVKLPLLGKLFSCIRCLSFWTGLFIFGMLTKYDYIHEIFGLPLYFNFIIYPFIQSGVSVIIESFVIFLRKSN